MSGPIEKVVAGRRRLSAVQKADTERLVLRVLADGPLRLDELRARCGVSEWTLRRALRRLEAACRVRTAGATGCGRFRVVSLLGSFHPLDRDTRGRAYNERRGDRGRDGGLPPTPAEIAARAAEVRAENMRRKLAQPPPPNPRPGIRLVKSSRLPLLPESGAGWLMIDVEARP